MQKMTYQSWLKPLVLTLVGVSLFATVHAHDVNKDINIDDGMSTKGQSTVNGSISVGSGVIISGSLDSVNGSIDVGDNTQLRDASVVNGRISLGDGITADDVGSVNGRIQIGENAKISGDVSAVNGGIELRTGSSIGRDVSNVNGRINVAGTEIGGDLSTVTGDIFLTSNSVLRGDLIIEKPGGWSWSESSDKPRIVIGPGSKVLGKIIAKREIDLFVSDSAEVGGVTGKASMDQAIRFSGDQP